jgi:hypothetical protein
MMNNVQMKKNKLKMRKLTEIVTEIVIRIIAMSETTKIIE